MKNNFFILGHSGSGTSLLRGLLNAHSRIECGFEIWGGIESWTKSAKDCKQIWGNKQPLQKMWSHGMQHADIKELIDHFLIIWIVRRYDKWKKNQKAAYAIENWEKGRKLYWAIRNHKPSGIMEISFEDLLLRPEPELRRVCAFLHIRYERRMLREGVNDTGHKQYNYGQIMLDRI